MRTLWDALDEDQWRKLRVAWAVVGVMLAFVIGAIGLVRGTRTLGTLAEVSIALACIGIFPLLRRSAERKLPEELGARRVSSESFPKSFSEAASASLAGGAAKAPAFSVIEHGNVNGFVKGSLSAPHFLVTTAFLHLPLAEQRAGFALLLGRLKADPMVFIAAQEMRQADRPTGGDYAGSLTQDQAALSPEELWTEIAAAADREGLMILKEPEPIIALLERLAATDTSMGRSISPAGSYRFLSYPASKRLRSG
ncbi:MAG TPA: hypothetical protein VLA05_05720, partial [Coriobacteriia bacterium]|nr:hypothetical protein [Coriobacteriia bacterium]